MQAEVILVGGSLAKRHGDREVLERAGYEVREMISLDDAVERARVQPPLAVVTELPGSGDAIVRFVDRLRRHPRTRDVPVVVLGALPDPSAEAESPNLSCLPEPCSPRRLLEEIAFLTRPLKAPPRAFGVRPDEDEDREQEELFGRLLRPSADGRHPTEPRQ